MESDSIKMVILITVIIIVIIIKVERYKTEKRSEYSGLMKNTRLWQNYRRRFRTVMNKRSNKQFYNPREIEKISFRVPIFLDGKLAVIRFFFSD